MKIPDLDKLIVATLAEAYAIAIVINIIHCKPANAWEAFGATLLAFALALPMVPITWAALLILFVPVYILMQYLGIVPRKDKLPASRKEKATALDVVRSGTSKSVDTPQLPAVPELPKRPKTPQLPAVPEPPKTSKSTTQPKSPKTPQLPAVPEKSKLPKKIDQP